MRVCLLVDVVEFRLPILLKPMYCVAQSSCSSPEMPPLALNVFEMLGATQVRARHRDQLHPRPVVEEANLIRFPAP